MRLFGSMRIASAVVILELVPGSMVTVDMSADNPGEWMLHCHVADHIDAGMLTTYEIRPAELSARARPRP